MGLRYASLVPAVIMDRLGDGKDIGRGGEFGQLAAGRKYIPGRRLLPFFDDLPGHLVYPPRGLRLNLRRFDIPVDNVLGKKLHRRLQVHFVAKT